MLAPEQVQAVCERYSGQDWWVRPSIPPDRLETARKTWRQPPQGDVIAFADTTVFRSGKEGLAVLHEGVVWHSGGDSSTRDAYTWRELAQVPVRAFGNYLQIGEGALNASALTMKQEDLAACLRGLQALAVAAGAPRPPAFVPEGGAFPAPGEPPPDGDELQAMLEAQSEWLHVAPDVPPKKERNARETMRIPPDQPVLALMDATILGSAKDGVAVTTGGLYWRNGIVGGNDNGRLTWAALARARVMPAKEMVILGEQDWLNCYPRQFAGLHQLVLQLQWWARARLEPDARRNAIHAAGEVEPAPPEPDPGTPRWHLAVDGQQFGPYSARTVAAMAAAGQVNADAAYAWAEGMAGWVPLREAPELAALLAPPAASAPPPVPVAASPVATAPAAARPARRTPAVPAEAEAPIDINNAPLEDLLGLPGMTRAGAERIVQERGTRGGFSDVDQVGQLLRLKPHHVERMRRMVTFGRIIASRGRIVDF